MPYTTKDLTTALHGLSINKGDVVLVRAATKAVGETQGRSTEVLLAALREAVGVEGTLVGLAFTKSGSRLRRSRAPIFTLASPPITGGFAAAMLALPGAYRSQHPTNSFVAVGPLAEKLLSDHDHSKSSFFPMNALLQHDAKMLLVGCVSSSPGFSTVHLAQEHLGLATKSLLSHQFGAFYERDGKRAWFSRQDVAGCSAGFWKFYARYVERELLSTGRVGDAYSIAIDCKHAYAVERAELETNPRFALCDRKYCLSCRATRLYNLRDLPLFAARIAFATDRIAKIRGSS